MKTVFCIAEDRRTEHVGLRFLLASLRRCAPDVPVMLFRPDPEPELLEWIRSGFPLVSVVPARPPGSGGSWNCKPTALLPALEGTGDPEAIWLDSDLILTRDPRKLFARHGPEALWLAQEMVSSANQGTAVRTRGWGWPVAREWPISLNSCVIRVTGTHRALLQRWHEKLNDPTYGHWQARPFAERPPAFLSDQDVLAALLGTAEFKDFPVRALRSGREIIHSGGARAQPLGERLAGLFHPIPTFLHGGGHKPWIVLGPERDLPGFFFRFRRLLQETSPYVAAAKGLRNEVGIECPWLDFRSPLGVLGRAAGLGHYGLRGLPYAAIGTFLMWLHRFRR